MGALGLQNKPGLSLMEHTSQPGETLRFSHKLAEEYLKKSQLIVQLAQRRHKTRNASISTREKWSSQSACPSSTGQREGNSNLLPAGQPLAVSDSATRKVGKVTCSDSPLPTDGSQKKKEPQAEQAWCPAAFDWSASAHDSHQDSVESNFSV